MIKLSTYLKQYKVGDMVDVVCNGAVQKGMVRTPLSAKTYKHSHSGNITENDLEHILILLHSPTKSTTAKPASSTT